MKNVTMSLGLVMIFALGVPAFAATLTWVGPATGGDWETAANWDTNTVPTSEDIVNVGSGNTVEVNSADAVLYRNGSAGTININNGGVLTGVHGYTLRYITLVNVNSGGLLPAGETWDVRCNVTIAAGGAMTGTDNVGYYSNGATLTVAGTFSPCGSTSADTFNVGGTGSYSGILDLQSTGTLNLDIFGNGDNENIDAIGESASTTVNLNAGTIVLNVQGGYTPQVGDSFDLWEQTNAYATMNVGDGSNIVLSGYSLDTSQWATDGIVTVVAPEPTTMCLLAAGGLALLKRRRR